MFKIKRRAQSDGAVNEWIDDLKEPVWLPDPDEDNSLQQRHRAGAKLTAQKKRTRTEGEINNVVKALVKQGEKITFGSIAKLTGISRQGLHKHYADFIKSIEV